jgi:hypothetical protein
MSQRFDLEAFRTNLEAQRKRLAEQKSVQSPVELKTRAATMRLIDRSLMLIRSCKN